MLPVCLSLKGKNVCVVGAGKVALRKVKQLLNEEALVTVISPDRIEEFNDLAIHYIHDYYSIDYIKDMFMVYASTNQKEVNHQIVDDCQKLNILCGSATYDQEASMYSMVSYHHDLALIALSTDQKLPYSKPLLQQMSKVLDDNQERIQLLKKIRPYILGYVKNTREYFEKLMTIDIEIIRFLYQSLKTRTGIIYIYHHSDYKETFDFDDGIVLSLHEFESIKDLFISDVVYHVVPLILEKGYIYHKIENMLDQHWIYHQPLIQSSKDIEYLLSLYNDDKYEMIYIIHPRSDKVLKRQIQDILGDKGKVYEFTEYMMLSLEKQYKIVFLLMTHGKHYQDLVRKMNYYQSMGYQIEYSDVLLENSNIKEYIQSKVKEPA